jgi:cobalamin biosynthesis protein CobT
VQLALQKNELVDEDEMDLYHGGMLCGSEGYEEEAGVMSYDEVSGNPIPLGSTAENVRDDIDANLSSGEYVLPAHVVKYHGLKHIMEMQAEAEMGLMSMHMDGLIQHVEEEVTECPMCEGKGCDHCENTGSHSGKSDSEGTEEAEVQASDDTEQEEAEAEAEASEEIPSEEMDVEIATVKVDDHLNDDEDMEISPVSKPLPAFVKKQKYAFAV